IRDPPRSEATLLRAIGPRSPVSHPPHATVRPAMQTSLARRQRQRRNGYRNRPKGHAAVAAGAIALPLFLFSTFLIVGFIGFAGAVSAYAYFAQGLDEPKQVLENLTFTQQSKVYDRGGDIELAKLGD